MEGKTGQPSMGPRPEDRGKQSGLRSIASGKDSFNGATTRRSWKTWIVRRPPRMVTAFNGATTRRSWKTTTFSAADTRTTSFNGATTRRSWKTTTSSSQSSPFSRLQWGHDPKIVENSKTVRERSGRRYPSMGPRPEDRGKPRSKRSIRTGSRSFNGATTRRSWKTRRRRSEHHAGQRPSMGPRPEDRGKRDARVDGAACRRAFNGATTRRSWKTLGSRYDLIDVWFLQWGHDPKIVENTRAVTGLSQLCHLQWGHDPKIVENFITLLL